MFCQGWGWCGSCCRCFLCSSPSTHHTQHQQEYILINKIKQQRNHYDWKFLQQPPVQYNWRGATITIDLLYYIHCVFCCPVSKILGCNCISGVSHNMRQLVARVELFMDMLQYMCELSRYIIQDTRYYNVYRSSTWGLLINCIKMKFYHKFSNFIIHSLEEIFYR